MKKLTLLLISISMIYYQKAHAQASTTSHAGNAGEYCGWDNSTTLDFDLKHNRSTYNINFFTTNTSGTGKRVTIDQNGFVGIGFATPNYHLQLYNSANTSDVFTQYTTGSTGNASGNGFLVGVHGHVVGMSTVNDAELIQQENGPMNFHTFNVQRVVIKGGSTMVSTAGYVGIGNSFVSPVSRLHLREAGNNTVYFQMTGNNTGDAAGDGFRIALLNTGTAGNNSVRLLQQVNAAMEFHTNSLERVRITAGGSVGINTTNPTFGPGLAVATEINSGTANMSGVRLTQLNSSSSSGGIGTFSHFLTVDSDGDVVLGDAVSGAENGTSITSGKVRLGNNPLLLNTNIAMQNVGTSHTLTLNATLGDIVFSDFGVTSGGDNFVIKADVSDNSATTNTGVRTLVSGNGAINTGVYSLVSGTGAAVNTGALFSASGGASSIGGSFVGVSATTNTGGYFQAGGLSTCMSLPTPGFTTPDFIGGEFKSFDSGNSGTNLAGKFTSCGASAFNIGIYAGVGATGSATNYAAYFDGDVYVNGGANSGTGFLVASDQVLKTNIAPIGNAMNIINQLLPKEFYLDTNNIYGIRLNSKKQYGIIAQELLPILPELINEVNKPAGYDNQGNIITQPLTYKVVNYNALFGIMLKGMQEQDERIDVLEQELASCCPSNLRTGSEEFPVSQTIELASSDAILYQNIPNPFQGSTTIRYFIPANANQPKIIFQDETGKTINETVLTETGQNSIEINTKSLNSGIYSYSLQIGDKIYDTKKMIRTK